MRTSAQLNLSDWGCLFDLLSNPTQADCQKGSGLWMRELIQPKATRDWARSATDDYWLPIVAIATKWSGFHRGKQAEAVDGQLRSEWKRGGPGFQTRTYEFRVGSAFCWNCCGVVLNNTDF